MRKGHRLGTLLFQYPHGGPHEQRIDNPGLASGLVIGIIQGFGGYLLTGFCGPLGKEPDNIFFIESWRGTRNPP
jgi:hypothetical protein